MGLIMNGNDWLTGGSYNRARSNHTVMYWLRLDNSSSTRRPFGNTGAWEARTSGTTLTSDYLQSGTLNTVSLTVGVFAHVAWQVNVSAGRRDAYVNGQLVNSVASASFSSSQNGNIRIGVTPGGSGQGWHGVIDDIRVYDRIVPAAQIQTIYACRGKDGILDSLALWYPLNEGAEGTTTTGAIERIQGLNATNVTNNPRYNYDAGIMYRDVL